MSQRECLILGDLHLGPAARAGTELAAAELLGCHAGCELICLGDWFDLSADTSGLQAHEAVVTHLEHHSVLTRALQRHLGSGGKVTLMVGNHDAELGGTGVRQAVLRHLQLSALVDLSIEPWWIRRGNVHLEHGHVWDPDNAPIHPLAVTSHQHEPLGVALTRRVLAPTGAFQFAHAHQTTPLAGLIRVLRELQWQAPEVIVRYFATGLGIFWRAAHRGHAATERDGDRAIASFATERGMDETVLRELTLLRPTPRHASAAATFARLYLDRAAATVATVVSATAGLVEHTTGYLVVAAAGAVYLAGSRRDRAHRYSASLEQRIEAAALGIGPVVHADTVVFGHTHVPEARAGYVNSGAFGFPTDQGRPYLLLDAQGRLRRGWMNQSNEIEPLSLNSA